MDSVPHQPRLDEAPVLIEGSGDEGGFQTGDAVPEAQLKVDGPLGVQAEDFINDFEGLVSGSPF